MPASIRLMSWNIQKKQTNSEFVARMMQIHAIDICALLEVPNSADFSICYGITSELNNLNYKSGTWKWRAIKVGDESVAYIWHEPAAGPNAFKALRYSNDAIREIAGPVVKDATGALLYFPKTQTTWASVPGKQGGRRAAYCAFETNDGAAARRFTFLDIHTPFAASLIQAYSAFVYSKAYEITAVDTLRAITAMSLPSSAAKNAIAAKIQPLIPGGGLRKTAAELATSLAETAVNSVRESATTSFEAGNDVTAAMRDAAIKASSAAAAGLKEAFDLKYPPTNDNLASLTCACAEAAVMAAAYLGASIRPATAPAGATASAPAAAATAAAAVDDELDALVWPSKRARSLSAWSTLVADAARPAVHAVMATFTFGAIPTQNVDASILAGDFNIDYPDTNNHYPKLTAGDNAYTSLLALAGANGASIQDTTTRSTAFSSPFIYRLLSPNPLQTTNRAAANYVPLDVSSMAGKKHMGYDVWFNALRALAEAQGVTWAPLTRTPYSDRLTDAFDRHDVINVPRLFRANAYDNMFVHGATVTNRGMLDVMTELGSYADGQTLTNMEPTTFAPNPWPKAKGRLNAAARAVIIAKNPAKFTYNGDVLSPTLGDARSVAVFFDKYISDHLPVFVEIQI